MIAYIVRQMLRHLVIRLVMSATFVVLRQRREATEYNSRLINLATRDVLVSAALLGIIFAAITIIFVASIKGGANVLTVAAGMLLSIGLSQQIMSIGIDAVTINLNGFLTSWNSILYLISRKRASPEWRFIENEAHQVFIHPHIVYAVPAKLDQLKVSTAQIITYVNEEEPSLLSFAQHTIDHIRNRLLLYDRIAGIQQRTGNVNPVVFIALGTLLWLLS
ncbi:MAG: hypothetical protein ACE5JV_02260 [Nitrososphaerales archaeon]